VSDFTTYTLGLILHVLSAIVLLGPAFLLPLVPRVIAGTPPTPVLKLMLLIERYVAIFFVVQLFTGIWLILEADFASFGKQVWLHTSILLFVIAAGLSTGFQMPRVRKALAASERGDAAEVARLLRPAEKVVGPILGVLMVVIVVLMVWQPVAS